MLSAPFRPGPGAATMSEPQDPSSQVNRNRKWKHRVGQLPWLQRGRPATWCQAAGGRVARGLQKGRQPRKGRLALQSLLQTYPSRRGSECPPPPPGTSTFSPLLLQSAKVRGT